MAADERRVRAWFESLGEEDRLRRYTLAEIRAAVGIPATRLRVALYRLEWKRLTDDGFRLVVYQGPLLRSTQRASAAVASVNYTTEVIFHG